jgi:hypothetical protein
MKRILNWIRAHCNEICITHIIVCIVMFFAQYIILSIFYNTLFLGLIIILPLCYAWYLSLSNEPNIPREESFKNQRDVLIENKKLKQIIRNQARLRNIDIL